jgi:arylsulfatase A-like enzyme
MTRFPELLSEAGFFTVHAASFNWLKSDFGVVRGFDVVDYDALPGPRWKPVEALIDALALRLGEVGERPAFLYAHINDTHAPYALGGDRGAPFQRYARALTLVDAQLGRLLEAVEAQGLGPRTYVIVTADHGEAFGEHRRMAHGNSLYQEIAHVPLVIRGPGIAPATVATRVSLIDLGPTILDLFGLPTPAAFMGESLLPALAGQPFAPTRPILAQLGSLRSLVTPEGLKVIRNTHGGTVEAYDLEADPRETENLIGQERAEIREALTILDTFFEVQQFRREGYVEPYRAF